MNKKKILLEPSNYYHIYNHAVGKENIFRNTDNYYYFLEKYNQHIMPICKTYAYCLLPNHFHFLISINSNKNLINFFNRKYFEKHKEQPITKLITQQFSNFFNAYSKAFNKQNTRTGALFCDYFERKKVDNKTYFMKLMHYIHFNPVLHGLVNEINDWKFTSFHLYESNNSTFITKNKAMGWFQNDKDFFKYHQEPVDEKLVNELAY